MSEPLRVGSLFSGVGGFDLGLERAGMRVVWQSEIDRYASRVLARHWPGVPNHGDIRRIDFARVAPVDVLCGGFPCQDISHAGRGAGIDGPQSGLWSEYVRAIRDLRPRYAVVENVAALRGRGLDRVLGDLAALGYDAEWDCIPASAVGAPHRRDRLWLVAYPDRESVHCLLHGRRHPGGRAPAPAGPLHAGDARGGGGVARGHRERRAERDAPALAGQAGFARRCDAEERRAGGAPAEPGMGRSADGVFAGLDGGVSAWAGDWEAGIPRTVEHAPNAAARLRALGNAVVPQVAELIGRWIVTHAAATTSSAAAA